jgi:hypothetical protein
MSRRVTSDILSRTVWTGKLASSCSAFRIANNALRWAAAIACRAQAGRRVFELACARYLNDAFPILFSY